MISIFGLRGRRLAIATTATFVVAGGVAWAAIPGDGGVIQGCYKKNSGQLRVVESAASCSPSEVALTWNQTGPKGDPGTNGVSPTVAQLAVGDTNCPAGGAAITDADNTSAYVCNGEAGADGDPFSGTFTSPNGQYSISVTDTGVTIAHGAGPVITLAGNDITVKSSNTLNVEAAGALTLKAGSNASLKANGTTTVQSSGPLSLQGAIVGINGCGRPAARVGDNVLISAGGEFPPYVGQIITGAPTVCIG